MPLLALILIASGLVLDYAGITGRSPIDVFMAIIGKGFMPQPNSWQTVDIFGAAIPGSTWVDPNTGTPSAGGGSRGAVVAKALSQVGKPYVWDTPANANDANPRSFDCSGLTMWAYKQGAGMTLPHYTVDQERMGAAVSLSAAQPGDLLFWGPSSPHVAMYIGEGKLVHAPNPSKKVEVVPVFNQATIVVRNLLGPFAKTVN